LKKSYDDYISEETKRFYEKVSQNIKKYRKHTKESQLKFSHNVGFNSVSFYCDCENNKNGKHFNLLHVVNIAKYLK
jgi:hypothetical protein